MWSFCCYFNVKLIGELLKYLWKFLCFGEVFEVLVVMELKRGWLCVKGICCLLKLLIVCIVGILEYFFVICICISECYDWI